MKPLSWMLLALFLSALLSKAAPLAVDPQVMMSDQEFLAEQARASERAAPSAPVESAPPIAAPPLASKGSKATGVAPKAKATPAPSSRIAGRVRGLPPETMADVTTLPDDFGDDRDREWDRSRDHGFDRDRDWGRDAEWDRERDRDSGRAPEEWVVRPRRHAEPSRFYPEDELPRKVQHIRRFIHRLLPF